MSSATANKTPSTGTKATSKTASSAAASRTPTKPSTAAAANGAAKTRPGRSNVSGTPVSARAAVKKPATSSNLSSTSQAEDSDDDSREEQAALLQTLKDRLQTAETEAEERKKQVDVLSARLDEALVEQAKLEERAHEEEEKVESLENVRRELTRQHRELESIYEAEHKQAMQDKEETQLREEELQEVIQRLKETMAHKHTQVGEGDEERASRASSLRMTSSRNNSSQNLDSASSFAPPSSIQRSNSRSDSKLIHQKDKIIEDLRLELAEYQVKLLEAENAGGGRMRELEKQILETRMTNARLMEDNESFQLLLGEKTLNGDLSRGDFLRESSAPSTSLADELQSAEGVDSEVVRRLESEVNSMKDQNKALTLYINKIIGRLLTKQGFESVLGDDSEGEQGGTRVDKNKELPPPPQENDQPQGFLQRAKSVALGANRPQRRPMSFMGPPLPVATNQQSAHEDPATAPSIPLTRSASTRNPSGSYTHRRSTSEIQANNTRSPPTSTTPGVSSPGIVSPRNSFFGVPYAAGTANPISRQPSGQQVPIHEERESDAKTDTSSSSYVDTPSPPRRLERAETTTGVMKGKGMRPLRLVQNEEEASKARKAANRASWFGGLFGQNPAQQQQAPQPPQNQDNA